jgi:hypothetical protein
MGPRNARRRDDRRADDRPPVSRGEIRRGLSDRPLAEVWPAVLGWSLELQPFWVEAIRRFADVAELPVARRDRHLAAAEQAFDRMDDWWNGRAKLVKARRNEIDSAISFIRNTALHTELRLLLQAPVARHVASALRGCLNLGSGSYRPEQLPEITAGLVYDWAECRTLFPGDSSVLLQHVPPDARPPTVGTVGPEFFDEHQLSYGVPADRFGLRREADAVYAEARTIWERFDEPVAWALPDDFWSRRYDGTYHAMHYGELRAFHERNRPLRA